MNYLLGGTIWAPRSSARTTNSGVTPSIRSSGGSIIDLDHSTSRSRSNRTERQPATSTTSTTESDSSAVKGQLIQHRAIECAVVLGGAAEQTVQVPPPPLAERLYLIGHTPYALETNEASTWGYAPPGRYGRHWKRKSPQY